MNTSTKKRIGMRRFTAWLPVTLLICVWFFASCAQAPGARTAKAVVAEEKTLAPQPAGAPAQDAAPPCRAGTPREQFLCDLSNAALERTTHAVVYDPAYVRIPYPGGDVPAGRGVCADEVIRPYRALGIDLQKNVHEDMAANFGKYPKKWGLKKTDTNIDHRRVLNLMVFFARKGEKLAVTDKAADYGTGDIVAWDLTGDGLTHIGILTHLRSEDGQRPLIVHNIGAGPQLEDVLFNWKIIGHYRYYGGRKFSKSVTAPAGNGRNP
jgi:uncharacterized protein